MAKIHVEQGSLGKFSFYDATAVAAEHRGWSLGTFVTDEDGSPLTDAFEVKFAEYKAGQERSEWATLSPGVTFHIVLSGAMRQILAPNGIEVEHVERVVRAGEACFFDNSVPHKWVILEDGVQITVRRLRI